MSRNWTPPVHQFPDPCDQPAGTSSPRRTECSDLGCPSWQSFRVPKPRSKGITLLPGQVFLVFVGSPFPTSTEHSGRPQQALEWTTPGTVCPVRIHYEAPTQLVASDSVSNNISNRTQVVERIKVSCRNLNKHLSKWFLVAVAPVAMLTSWVISSHHSFILVLGASGNLAM